MGRERTDVRQSGRPTFFAVALVGLREWPQPSAGQAGVVV
jgi:hypothetical protein